MEFLQENWPPMIVAAFAILTWFLLRSKATKLETTEDLQEKIGNGKPVVVEFFANY